MTTISQTPNRRDGLIGTILRLVAACALLIIGAYLVMLGAGKLFSYSKPAAEFNRLEAIEAMSYAEFARGA